MTSGTAEVAVPVPVVGAFHYRVPPALDAAARPGCRVRVRFAGRLIVGYLIARDTPPPAGVRLAAIEAVLDDDLPTFDADLLGFVLTATLVTTATIAWFRRGHLLSAVLVSLVAALFIDYAFRGWLLVPLPQGPFDVLPW